jgi:hypothetical protein
MLQGGGSNVRAESQGGLGELGGCERRRECSKGSFWHLGPGGGWWSRHRVVVVTKEGARG